MEVPVARRDRIEEYWSWVAVVLFVLLETMEVPVARRDRIEEYWSWVAVVLFVLLTLDLLTTIYASSVVGTGAEANPIVRWALARGVWYLIGVNLGALGLLAVLFYGLIRLIRETPEPYDDVIALGFEIWVGLLIAVGLIIFANNLLVIFTGRDIVSVIFTGAG